MDLGTAERLASVADPQAVSALEAHRNSPAVKKAIAEQFGTLLLQRVLQNSEGDALTMTGGAGGTMINSLYASTVAQTVMSGDRLDLADMLFRSLAAAQTPATGASEQPPPSTAIPSPATPRQGGFSLAPYWQADGMRPFAHGPAMGSPTGGVTTMAPPPYGALPAAPAPVPGSGVPAPGTRPAAGASPAGPIPEDEVPEDGAAIARFARQVGPAVQWAAGQLGVSPRILLAQAALESGWGRSAIGNNVFGIKAGPSWSQAQVSATTHEFENGQRVTEQASFRAYASLGAAVADYVSLISDNHRYRTAIGAGDDVRAYGKALVRGGYATDSDYADKLAAIVASPSLAAAMAELDAPRQPQSAANTG
jgi:flagellar protein FlgJ